MNHPFFRSKYIFFIYTAIWGLIAVLHFVFLRFFLIGDTLVSIGDSLVFNTLFYILGLAMWFPISFYKVKDTKFLNLFLNHLSLLVFTGFVWLGLGYNILNAIYSYHMGYASFLYDSLLFRGISGVFFYSTTVLIYYLLSFYNNLQKKISDEAKLRELLKEAELNFLKAQINPHFLFNSLNSITSLTLAEPEKARDMIIKLSDFLRYVISQNEKKPSSLNKEIENIQRYLEIEKVRFGDKLNFVFNSSVNMDESLIPILILQPIYENAIKHGVYESTNPITIFTDISFFNNNLRISIKNNYDPASSAFKGAGIGLKNIKQRLNLIYQNPNLIEIIKGDNTFEVTLTIPQIN